MTPADKQKIKDAFNNAVNASPFADDVVEGMQTREGGPITRRSLIAWTLENDQFYSQVDNLLAQGEVSLDQFIQRFEDGMKKPISRGPRP